MDQDSVGTWDCTLCTYRNSADKFKCDICDLRRGTSTRKPRCNADTIVAQVVKQQEQLKQQTKTNRSTNQDTQDVPTTSLEKKLKVEKRSHEPDESDASAHESDSTEIGEAEVPSPNKLTIEGNYIKTSRPIVSGTTGVIIDKRRFKQLSVTVYDVTVTFTEYATRQYKYVRKKKRR